MTVAAKTENVGLELDQMGWFSKVLEKVRDSQCTDIRIREGEPVRLETLKESTPLMDVIPSSDEINMLLDRTLPADVLQTMKDDVLKELLGDGVFSQVSSLSAGLAMSDTERPTLYGYSHGNSYEYAFTVKGYGRFRVSFSRSFQGRQFSIRKLPYQIPKLSDLDKLGLLSKFFEMFNFDSLPPKGLVLHTGATGSGKSTLIASIIDHIAKRISGGIYTFENPIEYLFTFPRAFVSQYEIPTHQPTFIDGIRMSLRNNLAVIMVGEVRDSSEVQSIIEAANRKHLVFSTLHAPDALSTVKHLVGAGPSDSKSWRNMVAMAIKAVVSHKLIFTKEKGFLLIPEVLIPDATVRKHIVEANFEALEQMFEQGSLKNNGSVTFKESIRKLVEVGAIDKKHSEELMMSA